MNTSVTRREALKTAAALTAGLAMPMASHAQEAPKRPNILFIMTDDHARHALSCYGSRLAKTPNLDRIAQEGVRFDNAFCTNALCGPSRASILTGKYSHRNGVMTNGGPGFDGSQQTFPKLLQQAGYQTAIVGKWHLQSAPTGFDYSIILPDQGIYHNPILIEQGGHKRIDGYVTDIITERAIDFVRGRDKSKPFCLMCHHKAPHRSWEPDDKHKDLFEADLPLPETFDDDYKGRGPAASHAAMRVLEDLTAEDVKGQWPQGLSPEELKRWKYQRYIKDYLRVSASVDDNVGRLLDFLDAEGLDDNTVVIYTSDNGFFLGDHGWYDKRFMYEESLCVPFLVRYPAEIKPGTSSGDFVLNLDVAAAALDYAGVALPADVQGRSFRQSARGETPADWRKSMYYHYYEYPKPHQVCPHYGVRTERYKLIKFYGVMDYWELFDLEKDPHELNNVYAEAAYAPLVEELKTELARLRVQYEDQA